MKIQYITNKIINYTTIEKDLNEYSNSQKYNIHIKISTFENYISPNYFDINIIDLDNIWEFNENYKKNILNDKFIHLRESLSQMKDSKVIFLIPKDQKCYEKRLDSILGSYYSKESELKNNLNLLSNTINFFLKSTKLTNILYEKNFTKILDKISLVSDFYLKDFVEGEVLTKSFKGEKITTLRLDETYYITTLIFSLDIAENEVFFEEIILFLKGVSLFIEEKSSVPIWMEELNYFDDIIQKEKISEELKKIEESKLIIKAAEEKLAKNLYFKSILYSSGDELVRTTFDILERILDYNLSTFVDNKKEDFLIKKDDVTFIGEIKGVNNSVKNNNITQVMTHFGSYLDSLQDKKIEENVKALLIINPNRDRKPIAREKIHDNQIKLAKKNDVLIIQTEVLLKIFESFENGQITSNEIKELFKSNSGVLEFKR